MPNAAATHRGERWILFAGAGISMLPPTGLPAWRDVNGIVIGSLAAGAATLLGAERVERAQRILLERHTRERLPPEFQAEILADVLGSAYFEVLRHLDSDRPNVAHLAVALLARAGCVQAVLTTNFDRALEAAFERAEAPYEALFAREHFAHAERFDGRAPGGPCPILKIHGSVADPGTLIDTLAQRKRGLAPALVAGVQRLLHAGPWAFLGWSGLDLEAEPGYLGLAREAPTAAGFRWLVRPGSAPRPCVERLAAQYGERAEIVVADLADWLLELADSIDPSLRREAEDLLASVPNAPGSAGDPLAPLRAGAEEWAAAISPEACAVALTRLVAAAAEPQFALELWSELLTAARAYAPGAAPVLVIGGAKTTVEALAAHALGCALGEVGRHEEAVQHLSRSLELLEAVDPETAGELVDRARRNLGWNLAALGHTTAARQLFEQALAGTRARADADQTATVLNDLASQEIAAGRYTEARPLAEEALELARSVGDETSRVQALNHLGVVAQRLEDYDRALELYRECEEVCTRLGADANAAVARGNRADVLALEGRDDEARELHESVLADLTRFERHAGRAETLQSLGFLARKRGDTDEAERRYQEAREILQALGDPRGEAQVLYKLAVLRASAEHFDAALELDLRALELLADRPSSTTGYALAHAGLCLLKLGRLDAAREVYGRCREVALELQDAFLCATALHNLGTLHLLQQENDDAAADFGAAAQLWQGLGRSSDFTQAHLGLAAARLDQALAALSTAGHAAPDPAGRRTAARRMTELYPALVETLGELGAAELAAHGCHSAGSTHEFLGEPTEAAAWYARAARAYAGIGAGTGHGARRDDPPGPVGPQ